MTGKASPPRARDTADRSETFRLLVTVGNRGAGGSAATTVRFYHSTDATITTSDTSVGTHRITALVPSGNYGVLISLPAPATPATYYYGACVDAVSGDAARSPTPPTTARLTRR